MQGTLHSTSVDQFKDQLIAKALYVFHKDDNWFSMDLMPLLSLVIRYDIATLTSYLKMVCTSKRKSMLSLCMRRLGMLCLHRLLCVGVGSHTESTTNRMQVMQL